MNHEFLAADLIGGSTWSLDVWPGHPLETEAKTLLRGVRVMVEDLRIRIDAHNVAAATYLGRRERVVFYVGQNVRDGGSTVYERGTDSDDEETT